MPLLDVPLFVLESVHSIWLPYVMHSLPCSSMNFSFALAFWAIEEIEINGRIMSSGIESFFRKFFIYNIRLISLIVARKLKKSKIFRRIFDIIGKQYN